MTRFKRDVYDRIKTLEAEVAGAYRAVEKLLSAKSKAESLKPRLVCHCECGLVYVGERKSIAAPSGLYTYYDIDPGACRFCLPAKQAKEKAMKWAEENPMLVGLCKNRHEALQQLGHRPSDDAQQAVAPKRKRREK